MKRLPWGVWDLLTRRASFAAAISVLSAAAPAVWWGHTLDRSDLRERLRAANASNLEALEDTLDEFAALAGEMRLRRAEACSAENLERFRRYLFTQQRLRVVGLVKDRHLLCSTALCLDGIETEAAHQAAAQLGPITCQGYHYARPMNIDQLGDWMVEHHRGNSGS